MDAIINKTVLLRAIAKAYMLSRADMIKLIKKYKPTFSNKSSNAEAVTAVFELGRTKPAFNNELATLLLNGKYLVTKTPAPSREISILPPASQANTTSTTTASQMQNAALNFRNVVTPEMIGGIADALGSILAVPQTDANYSATTSEFIKYMSETQQGVSAANNKNTYIVIAIIAVVGIIATILIYKTVK